MFAEQFALVSGTASYVFRGFQKSGQAVDILWKTLPESNSQCSTPEVCLNTVCAAMFAAAVLVQTLPPVISCLQFFDLLRLFGF